MCRDFKPQAVAEAFPVAGFRGAVQGAEARSWLQAPAEAVADQAVGVEGRDRDNGRDKAARPAWRLFGACNVCSGSAPIECVSAFTIASTIPSSMRVLIR